MHPSERRCRCTLICQVSGSGQLPCECDECQRRELLGARARIDTGSEVITPENMNEPRMKELLWPPFDKYLR